MVHHHGGRPYLSDHYVKNDEGLFQYHHFVNPTEEEFEEGIAHFRENACYETGVDVEYGDKLLMLVTCAYHVDKGRFIVLAKEVDYIDPAEAQPVS